MRYLVKVHRYGTRWLVQVPAFGVSGVINDRHQVSEMAQKLIAACGGAPARFDVELAWENGNGHDE